MPFVAIFGLDLGFKKIFETCLCRLSILDLELQPYLFFFIRPLLGPFRIFLGPLGLFLGLGSGPNPFLGPTYIA